MIFECRLCLNTKRKMTCMFIKPRLKTLKSLEMDSNGLNLPNISYVLYNMHTFGFFIVWLLRSVSIAFIFVYSQLLHWYMGNRIIIITGPYPMMTYANGNIFSFEVFFDLHLNKQLSKKSRSRWCETPLCPLWRHYNVMDMHNKSTTPNSLIRQGQCLWGYMTWRRIYFLT